jgi:hypothetical protein
MWIRLLLGLALLALGYYVGREVGRTQATAAARIAAARSGPRAVEYPAEPLQELRGRAC